MSWLARLSNTFRRDVVSQQISEEIEFHRYSWPAHSRLFQQPHCGAAHANYRQTRRRARGIAAGPFSRDDPVNERGESGSQPRPRRIWILFDSRALSRFLARLAPGVQRNIEAIEKNKPRQHPRPRAGLTTSPGPRQRLRCARGAAAGIQSGQVEEAP